ncbi:MAG: M23 family metallopeptidase [Myxococcales bacterium]|nr:M23 family metallopeptidase [Myxococcales bacterium]
MPRRPHLALLALALTAAACSTGEELSSSSLSGATLPTGASASASASASQGSGDSDSEGTTGDASSSGPTTWPATTGATSTSTTGLTTSTTSTSGDPCMEMGNCTTSGAMSDSGMVPDDPCENVADGIYCGDVLGGTADHQSLYQCAGGQTQSAQPCDLGCENNLCKKPPADMDPCAGANSGDGDYCGSTLPGGDGGALYTCIGGKTNKTQSCPDGCQVNPPGSPDKCNSADLCQYATSGNGAYCGSSLKGGIADDVLFQCVNKKTESQQTCANGCVQKPPGEPDVCAPMQGGNECCLDKPPGSLTQSYSACGNGGSHYGIDYGTAVGTPIYAGIAGTVVSMALGYPNCYNNGCSQSCWNSFNYVKIKSDCGDPNNQSNDFYVYYLHIDGVPGGIKQGSHVDQGQLLAYSGNSGCSSGPHIHIETVSVGKGQNAYLSTCNSENPASNYCP